MQDVFKTLAKFLQVDGTLANRIAEVQQEMSTAKKPKTGAARPT